MVILSRTNTTYCKSRSSSCASTMCGSPTEVDFIENMAQKQIKYETILGEQAEVLREDLPKFEAAMAQIQKSHLVAKNGQRWEPTQDSVDEYLTHCDEICRSTPRDFHDRVKIMHGAHAALMCLASCKVAQQDDRVQLAILKRHKELSAHPTPSIADTCEAPLFKPSIEPRRITAEELRLFQNPDDLHGKQFVLSVDNDDEPVMYEVIGYSKKRDRTVEYDVLFDDCGDPIMVDAKEMMTMLEDSLYLPI